MQKSKVNKVVTINQSSRDHKIHDPRLHPASFLEFLLTWYGLSKGVQTVACMYYNIVCVRSLIENVQAKRKKFFQYLIEGEESETNTDYWMDQLKAYFEMFDDVFDRTKVDLEQDMLEYLERDLAELQKELDGYERLLCTYFREYEIMANAHCNYEEEMKELINWWEDFQGRYIC